MADFESPGPGDLSTSAPSRRLLVIVVVVIVGLSVLWIWRTYVSHQVDSKARNAERSLRAVWREEDVSTLNRRYANAATAAASTGDYGKAAAIIPSVNGAVLAGAVFPAPMEVQAQYVVQSAGESVCIHVRAVGPAPNRVNVRRNAGACR